LIATLSLPIYFFDTGFILLLLFFLVCLFFPFSLPSLLSLSSHPSILDITIVITQARKYLIAHSIGTVTIARRIMGRWKKEGNQFPPSNKLVQE
jgi:hypothetical protein